jgi:hypothetical protein
MKTIFRFLNTGVMTVAVLAVGAVTGFGQDACADVDGQNALYTKFTENFQKKTAAELKIAADAAKGFLEKYGDCPSVKEQADYMRPWGPKLDKSIEGLKKKEIMDPLFARFDNAIKTDNAPELYAAGKEILTHDPANYNIIVPMGIVGWDLAAKNNNAHAEDALRYSKMALDAIKNGTAKAKPSGTYGALKYEFSKDQAINELTYAVGYLTYYYKKDKKGALPYYYELAQTGRYKDEPRIYLSIGNYYVDEAAPIIEEIAKLVQQLNTTTDEAGKADLEKQVKAKIGMFNGYAERAMDALGRAHQKATKPTDKTLKDSVYKQIQVLYGQRFPEKKDAPDTYISATIKNPMPNPTTPVAPVIDPEPATTTTSTSSAAPAATKPASAATTVPNKPMSTIPAKASVAKKAANR